MQTKRKLAFVPVFEVGQSSCIAGVVRIAYSILLRMPIAGGDHFVNELKIGIWVYL